MCVGGWVGGGGCSRRWAWGVGLNHMHVHFQRAWLFVVAVLA